MDDVKKASDLLFHSSIKGSYALAAITILYYDFALTLPMEVERFWPLKGFSWAPLLFYVNRYTSLLAHVPVIVEYFLTTSNPADKVAMSVVTPCHRLHVYHQYYAVAAQLVIGVLLIMRTYALYAQSRRVLGVLCVTAASVLALGCWSILSSGHASDPPQGRLWPRTGCIESLTDKEGIHLAIAWGGLLGFDLLIYLLTLRKALGTGRVDGQSLFSIVLRDASIYIAVIMVANVSNLMTLVLAPPPLKGVSTTFSNIMASIMVSRLLMNLRDPSLLSPPSSTTVRSGLHFASRDVGTTSDPSSMVVSVSEPTHT